MLSKIIRFVSVLTVVTVFTAGNAAAEDPAKTDKWQFHAGIYGVLPDLKGETADGSSIDIGLDTILDNLIFTVMGNLGARKGKWTFTADVLYLNMGDDESGSRPVDIGGQILPVEVKSDLDMRKPGSSHRWPATMS